MSFSRTVLKYGSDSGVCFGTSAQLCLGLRSVFVSTVYLASLYEFSVMFLCLLLLSVCHLPGLVLLLRGNLNISLKGSLVSGVSPAIITIPHQSILPGHESARDEQSRKGEKRVFPSHTVPRASSFLVSSLQEAERFRHCILETLRDTNQEVCRGSDTKFLEGSILFCFQKRNLVLLSLFSYNNQGNG